MRRLETVAGSGITKSSLGEALLRIQEENGAEMTLADTKNLVRLVFSQVETTSSGAITRAQLREALDETIDQVQVL